MAAGCATSQLCRTELRRKLHPLPRLQQPTPAKRGINPGLTVPKARETHEEAEQSPCFPKQPGWNKALPLPSAVRAAAAGPDAPHCDISGAGHDPDVCQRCRGRHARP